MARFAGAAAWVGLALLVVAFPLLREQLPLFESTSGVRPLAGAGELAVVLAAALAGALRVPSISSRWLRAAITAWFAWTFLAFCVADHYEAALVRQVEWWIHVAFGAAVFGLVRARPSRAGLVLDFVVVGVAVYGARLLVLYAGLDDPAAFSWSVALPGYTNVRHFGYAAALGVAVGLRRNLDEDGGSPAALARALVTSSVMWALLIWTGSRSGVLAIYAAGAAILPFVGPAARRRIAVCLPTSMVAGYALARPFQVLPDSLSRIASTIASPDRVDVWRQALKQVAEHPWFGLGPDGFLYLRLDSPMNIVQPHDVLLQFALEWGLPGLALTGFLAAAGTLHLWRTRRRDGPPLAGAGGAAVFGLFVVLGISLVDGSLYHANSLMLTACLIGVMAGSRPRGDEIRIGLGLAVAFAVGCALVLGLHATVLAVQRGPTPNPGDPAVAIVRRFPSDIDRVHVWGAVWAQQDPKTAVEWLHWGHDRARSRRAWKFYFAEGGILQAGGFQRLAVAHLEQALDLAPRREDRARVRPWLAYARGDGERPSLEDQGDPTIAP